MKNSREIVIDLVDKQLINGEEAFALINDILQSEILEAWKALNNKSNSDLLKVEKDWSLPSGWMGTANPSWIYNNATTTTACNATCGSS